MTGVAEDGWDVDSLLARAEAAVEGWPAEAEPCAVVVAAPVWVQCDADVASLLAKAEGCEAGWWDWPDPG